MVVKGPQVSETMAGKKRREEEGEVSEKKKPLEARREKKEKLTDSDRTTHSTLPLLNSQVGKKNREHILRSDGLGNVSERVDGGSTNSLLVSFEEVEKLEADSHPLSSGNKLGSTIG